MRKITTSLNECEAILIDLGGTLMHGAAAIAGAAECVFMLKKKRIPFFIVPNNNTDSTSGIVRKLKNAGFAVTSSDVITASQSAIAYMQREGLRSVLLVGSSEQEEEYREAGFIITHDRPDVVCIALDTELSYATLTRAMRCLHAGARYIALSESSFHRAADGFAPGIGATLQYLREVTGRAPDMITGKPSAYMMQHITDRVGVPAARMGIIGDQLSVDMAMAEEYGMVSALVLSGQTSREDVNSHTYQPDYIVESIESLMPLFQ